MCACVCTGVQVVYVHTCVCVCVGGGVMQIVERRGNVFLKIAGDKLTLMGKTFRKYQEKCRSTESPPKVLALKKIWSAEQQRTRFFSSYSILAGGKASAF